MARRRTLAPVLGLLVLSPVCAEYLWAYDSSTGRPLVLLGGLLVLAPLYGAPALLMREAARRWGLGWPGLLLLATAAGLLQAGVWDQSLFNTDYRAIPYWDELIGPTRVEALGVSAYTVLTFVGGHVVLSFGAPIAIVESLSGERRRRPWLGPIGIIVMVVLYAVAAALVLADHLDTEGGQASATQTLVVVGLALALVGAALLVGRRATSVGDRSAPAPLAVAVGSAVVASVNTVATPSVLGTTVLGLTGLVVIVAGLWLGRRPGWDHRHAAALGGGALVAVAVAAFFSQPLGSVTRVEQLAHNVTALVLVAGLTMLACRPLRAGPRPRFVPARGDVERWS